MSIVRCPRCNFAYQISPAYTGNVRCNQKGCTQIFKVTGGVTIPSQPVEKKAELDVMPELSHETSSGHSRDQAQSKSVHTGPSSQGRNRDVYDGGTDRYLNLKKYLNWLKTLAFIQLILTYIIAALVVLSKLLPIFSAAYFDPYVDLLISIPVSLLIAGFGYLTYVITVAGIEFVDVIIDIEANTRCVRDQIENTSK